MMNAEALANRCTRCHRTFAECGSDRQCDANRAANALYARVDALLRAWPDLTLAEAKALATEARS